MALQIDAKPVRPRHLVTFYDDDGSLVENVASYLAQGLAIGHAAIVIATQAHAHQLSTRLSNEGLDLTTSTWISLDAADTLSRFMGDQGLPDAQAFDQVVGTLVRQAGAGGRGVSAFGEMVALLWEAGNVAGAIELERLWNDLLDENDLSLFCAYPTAVTGDDAVNINHVCDLHTEVVELDAAARTAQRSFPRSNGAPSVARRFVVGRLKAWGMDTLILDAAVVLTELATNAVIHAGTGFHVEISMRADVLHLAVHDGNGVLPFTGNLLDDATGGRGLVIVEALSTRWGAHATDEGKVVWVEFDREVER